MKKGEAPGNQTNEPDWVEPELGKELPVTQSAAFLRPAQADIQADLGDLFRGAVQVMLETALNEAVRDMVGARRYERLSSRKDTLNGTYLRRLLTSMGLIEARMPRTRESGAPTEIVGRYARRTSEIDQMITQAYVQGVSTRDVSRLTNSLMGESVSKSTVSRITKSLEERIDGLRREPIRQEIPYLFLDATYVDARWARSVENVSALVAYGVGLDGHRHLLAVTIGSEESEESWGELLSQLLDRGLSGVRLVVSDDHRGLTKAVRRRLPEVKQQRCTVHLMRNVMVKAPRRLRGRVARAVVGILHAGSLTEAKKRLAAFRAGLGTQVPESLACLEGGFDAATQFFLFPEPHWPRIRSTNGVERLHGEIKRRTRAVGAFPDRQSALRLITAVALEATVVWSGRRYLDMTLLQNPEKEVTAAA
jgi:transposase-like protein